MRPYRELAALRGVYLEESYVLDIEAHPASLVVVLDLVLTVEHLDYRDPIDGEQYCYRRGSLTFGGISECRWSEQGRPPAVDATGERDYGNIDTFEWDNGRYILEGDWGHLDIRADQVELVLAANEVRRPGY